MHTHTRSHTFITGWLLAFSLFLSLLIPASVSAHGGASGVDTDTCRIPVDSHWVHFTAYQPQLSGTTEFCSAIPEIGMTTVVFDYEGKALRNMTVEFEITKEPEGTRVFYKEPMSYPTGSANTQVNFTETGSYLTHITLVNDGKKIDAHIPFKVGSSQTGISGSTWLILALVLGAIGYIVYLSNAGFKGAVDKILNKKSA
ncbi:MAG: hypothetical protein ACR2HF_05750 [Methylococcaceae bacterium]